MATYKIMITDGLAEKGKAYLREHGEVLDRSGISPEDLLKEVGEVDALIVRSRTKVNAAVFEAGKRLKVVGRAGIGVDNIDLNAARAAGVTVVNSPLATTVSVAELAMGLMLALVREIPRADASMKQNKWLKKEFEGHELYQKTLGIIGCGRIGSAVAERAQAFGMHVLAFDRFRPKDELCQCSEPVDDLNDLLARSDFISLHLPLTAETKNLLSHEQFARMKDGVYLINASRGGIVDEEALLAALNSGKVAGAGLDVFSVEPPSENNPLVMHPHVICTPHMGAQTHEAQARAGYDIATEVVAALKGEPLRWKCA
ncbi:hydroxyacid dehydrogenase [Anaerolinea sp.]|uniref:hydroxyacid dehydrogenase n=1 Tax=Anaerolinea sp. TaxID=1872519 RepID=UPI002ACE3ECD|nr:hydroxyacid dehydrogenase [Anaerolinea sp.]